MKRTPKNRSYKSTNYLMTLNGTILVGYFTVFQINSSKGSQKWLLLASFIGLSLSMTLLAWYRIRWPKRDVIYASLADKSTQKSVNDIMEFLEGIIEPLTRTRARLQVQHALQSATSKQEFDTLQKAIKEGTFKPEVNPEYDKEKEEKATKTIVGSILENLSHKSKSDFTKAYNMPIRESHAKIKHKIDMVAYRLRIHILIGSMVILAFSIIVAILQIPEM